MTKQYPLIYLNNHRYMTDKKAPKVKGLKLLILQKDILWGKVGQIATLQENMRSTCKVIGANKVPYHAQCDIDFSIEQGNCIPVLASDDKKLNLPLLPKVEEDNSHFKESLLSIDEKHRDPAFVSGFHYGYKAASSKKYTEEDMWKAAQFGYVESFRNESPDGNETAIWRKDFDIWLQSLNPQPIAVEVEMEEQSWIMGKFGRQPIKPSLWNLKKVNNIVQIVKWIYE